MVPLMESDASTIPRPYKGASVFRAAFKKVKSLFEELAEIDSHGNIFIYISLILTILRNQNTSL